jgi:mannose-6-phosphate isomerase
LPACLEREGGPTLREAIAANPETMLGESVCRRFAGELPFLLKVLAAAEPLSLQAHPNAAQAKAGFSLEQAEQVPLAAEQRSYKDPHHKPELIVALTPFSALYGFRRVEATRALFAALDVPALTPYLGPLAGPSPRAGLGETFARLVGASREMQRLLADATATAATNRLAFAGGFHGEFQLAARLGALYPGDIGVVLALLLNLVELRPLEGLYLPAGNLHAYLEGAGVEIMASSDNVLRGGLTKKHVNVPELLRILDFSELEPSPLTAEADGDEHVYRTDASEFRLARLELEGSLDVVQRGGAEILLVSAGAAELEIAGKSIAIPCGGSAFVPGAEGPYRLRGSATVFRASVP